MRDAKKSEMIFGLPQVPLAPLAPLLSILFGKYTFSQVLTLWLWIYYKKTSPSFRNGTKKMTTTLKWNIQSCTLAGHIQHTNTTSGNTPLSTIEEKDLGLYVTRLSVTTKYVPIAMDKLKCVTCCKTRYISWLTHILDSREGGKSIMDFCLMVLNKNNKKYYIFIHFTCFKHIQKWKDNNR